MQRTTVPESKQSEQKPDVLFVGAGPVGLMTAIQLKLFNPGCSILMLEKYEVYQRRHPLQLDDGSFIDTHPDPAFQELLRGLPGSIRTNELEEVLLKFARDLGIVIEHTHVKDCAALPKQYPSAKMIIGSDGSHSEVHRQVFGHEYQMNRTMQYIAEVKYEVEGRTRYLNKLTEVGPVTTYAKHFVAEYVGREKEGKTPVSIRIFTDEDTYEAMKAATFKSPYKLSDKDKIEEKLGQSIHAWLTARADIAGEKRIADSERITVTNLPIYASKEFVKEQHGVTWFLVGDAAFGVPYFRSLNNGILCSSQLANVLNAVLRGQRLEEKNSLKFTSISKLVQTPLEYYKSYVQSLWVREELFAQAKNVGVNILGASAATSQVMPVSRLKLAGTQAGKFYKMRMGESERAEKDEQSAASTSSGWSIFRKDSWSVQSQRSSYDGPEGAGEEGADEAEQHKGKPPKSKCVIS